jgi:hypothetical protein
MGVGKDYGLPPCMGIEGAAMQMGGWVFFPIVGTVLRKHRVSIPY